MQTFYEQDLILKNNIRGYQKKFKTKSGEYIKLDAPNNYASLSEVIASRFIQNTNLVEKYGFVEYQPCYVIIDNKSYLGCISKDFVKDNTLLTIEDIWETYYFQDFETFKRNHSGTIYNDFIEFLSNFNSKDLIIEYITDIITLDKIILNTDRHTNNIGVFLKGNDILPTPIFDNGESLLCNLEKYPLDMPIKYIKDKLKARPFSYRYNKQSKIFNQLSNSKFEVYSTKIYYDDLKEYYPSELIDRALFIISKYLSYYDII